MNEEFRKLNETPELYKSYDEFIENEGYLYEDFLLNYYDNDKFEIEEDEEKWE